jgi:glutathione synthase/RimK-type ligase-like ATP-grasp enzyme
MSEIKEHHVGIVYGHTDQFNPLFEALHKKGIVTTRVDPSHELYEPSDIRVPFSMIFNDLSSPRYLSHDAFYLQQNIEYIKAVETLISHRKLIVNNSYVSELIINRARQLSIFHSLKLRYPATRVISNTDQLFNACNELQFPLIIKSDHLNEFEKPKRYESISEVINDVINNTIKLHNRRLLIQEFVESKDNAIVKVEVIGGRVTFALKHFHAPGFTNDWPVVVKTELFIPSNALTKAIEEIAETAHIDAGSVTFKFDMSGNVNFIDIGTHTTHLPIHLKDFEANVVEPLANYLEQRLLAFKQLRLAV